MLDIPSGRDKRIETMNQACSHVIELMVRPHAKLLRTVPAGRHRAVPWISRQNSHLVDAVLDTVQGCDGHYPSRARRMVPKTLEYDGDFL